MHLKVERAPKCVVISKICAQENKSTFDKWDSVKHELLNWIFENNLGCLVTASVYTFTDNNIHSDSILELDSNAGKTYVLPNERWKREELKTVARSFQFEVAELWMRPDLGPDAAANMTSIDADNFWQLIDELTSADYHFDDLDTRIQAVGCLTDGDRLLWTNPSFQRTKFVLDNLKRLCTKLEIGIEGV